MFGPNKIYRPYWEVLILDIVQQVRGIIQKFQLGALKKMSQNLYQFAVFTGIKQPWSPLLVPNLRFRLHCMMHMTLLGFRARLTGAAGYIMYYEEA